MALDQIFIMFEPYYILKGHVPELKEYQEGFTEKSNKELKTKKLHVKSLTTSIFEELSSLIYIENKSFIAGLSPYIDDFEKYESINVLIWFQKELEKEFDTFTKPSKFYDLRGFSFKNAEVSRIKKFGITNLFLNILYKEDRDRYIYVVESSQLRSTTSLWKYKKPIIHKLFPKTSSIFFDIIKNRLLHFTITYFIKESISNSNYDLNKTFQFDKNYLLIFRTAKNLDLLNKFVAQKSIIELDDAFFNRLRLIIDQTDLFEDIDLNRITMEKLKQLLEKDTGLPKIDCFHYKKDKVSNRMLKLEVKELKSIKNK